MITNIESLTNLQILIARGTCGINDGSLLRLTKLTNLIKLDVWNNQTVTNINSLTTLRILNARRTYGITNDGLSKLTNIHTLDICFNPTIPDISPLIMLRVINIGHRNNLTKIPKSVKIIRDHRIIY